MKKKRHSINFGNIHNIHNKRNAKKEKCKCGRLILGKYVVCDFCAAKERKKDSISIRKEDMSDWGH